MADLYRIVYVSTGGNQHGVVYVTATSLANAIAASKSNDATHKQNVSATVMQHNIVSGS